MECVAVVLLLYGYKYNGLLLDLRLALQTPVIGALVTRKALKSGRIRKCVLLPADSTTSRQQLFASPRASMKTSLVLTLVSMVTVSHDRRTKHAYRPAT